MTHKASTARVLVICTGGTIGMQPGPTGLVPGRGLEQRARATLAQLPPARHGALPALEFLEYDDPIDSSSAHPDHWYRIGSDILSRQNACDGVVVLHGTDTLAWTAASLTWQLAGTGLPVIVTGAQRPLEAPDSDGTDNLEQALAFAALESLTGVYVAFGGVLLRGDHARKWDTEADRAFTSPNAAVAGYWQQHRAMLATEADRALPGPLPRPSTPPRAVQLARLVLWPGMSAEQLAALLEHADGVVLEAWGSGNLPDVAPLQEVLRRAIERGVAIVVISQCPFGRTNLQSYATGQALASLGVIDGADMTPEAAFTRLHCLMRYRHALTHF
ncbi:asparaginase [Kushneria sp. AK178]